MEPRHRTKYTRRFVVIVTALVSIIMILSLTAYIIVHGFISKINIVTTSDPAEYSYAGDDTGTIQSEDKIQDILTEEAEESDPGIPEASNEEINKIEDKIYKNLEENNTSIEYDENVYNVLLIGSDTRKAGGYGRSDVIMILSINKSTKKFVLTSLLRDIYLQIPGYRNNRINAAYAFGGAELLIDSIEQNFKIRIDRYASVDFYAFIDVVEAVGGIKLEVTKEEIPVMNNYITELNYLTEQEREWDYLISPGLQQLNGKQALGYVRNRYVGNNDFDRTARQRKVLRLIFDKVKTLNILELTDMLDVLLPKITTDMTESEIISLLLSLPAYRKYEIEQWSIPISGAYSSLRIRGMSILEIDFDKNIKQLHSRIYNKENN